VSYVVDLVYNASFCEGACVHHRPLNLVLLVTDLFHPVNSLAV
jgi:hypothetical protein